MAAGEPITRSQLADAVGMPELDLTTTLAGRDIDYDDLGRMIGWGLPIVAARVVGSCRWCAGGVL
ncbi:hypothetical protein BMW24_007040 [Mycobacterium heckeshornense]|nr:hypothetical protein ACT16_23420 [Mycobacterium heckeshornense]PIJ36423.1 hypothetical protein BMW24_007040 [Mycobacterium heckeshornense]